MRFPAVLFALGFLLPHTMAAIAQATDTFGQAVPVQLSGTSLRLPVSDTPIYIEDAH
jgi:hypothetical protein